MLDLGLALFVVGVVVGLGHSDFESLVEIQVEILG